MIFFLFVLLMLVTPAMANVAVPPGPWTLIFDSEFNGTGDYTHLDPVWNAASGNNLRGAMPGGFCWAAHSVTLNNHEVDFTAKPGCWIAGAPQTGEGGRIATGPQASKATFNCSPAGQVSINGVAHNGFCFSPTNTSGGATPEIYDEVLYRVPCSGANTQDHAIFWTVGHGPWPTTGEHDIFVTAAHSTTKMEGVINYGTSPSTAQFTEVMYPLPACGWHVAAEHWIGGATPRLEYWLDGAKKGAITQHVQTDPVMAMIELGWGNTPAPAVAKAVYFHVYGKNVSYPQVEPQTNYGGPGDTAGKILGH